MLYICTLLFSRWHRARGSSFKARQTKREEEMFFETEIRCKNVFLDISTEALFIKLYLSNPV